MGKMKFHHFWTPPGKIFPTSKQGDVNKLKNKVFWKSRGSG